jgi:hypothetical protein
LITALDDVGLLMYTIDAAMPTRASAEHAFTRPVTDIVVDATVFADDDEGADDDDDGAAGEGISFALSLSVMVLQDSDGRQVRSLCLDELGAIFFQPPHFFGRAASPSPSFTKFVQFLACSAQI